MPGTIDAELTRRWTRLGAICALLAVVVFVLATVLLEQGLAGQGPPGIYAIALSFGPLLLVAALGIHAFLVAGGDSVRLQLARTFLVVAAGVVTVAIALRGATVTLYMPLLESHADRSGNTAWNLGHRALEVGLRGCDLAWDIFLLLGIVLLGSVLLGRGRASKVIGAAGVLVGLVGLAFEALAWPGDPEEVIGQSIGPFAGLWFVALALLMLYSTRPRRRRRVSGSRA